MAIFLLLLLIFTNFSWGMDKPGQPAHNSSNPDPKALCAELMADKWDEATLAKFKALDRYKNSAALKEELLQSNLDALFQLSLGDRESVHAKISLVETNYHNKPLAPLLVSAQTSVHQTHNTATSLSLNHNGSGLACIDSSNKVHLISNHKLAGTCYTGQHPIETVKILEHDNLVRIMTKYGYVTFDATSSEQEDNIPFIGIKKMLCSPRGNWALFQLDTNQIGVAEIKPRGTTQLLPIQNPTCLAMDEKGKKGLIGTTSDLYLFSQTNKTITLEKVAKMTDTVIPHTDCVDVTADGKFGLATNNEGICRVELEDPHLSRIGRRDTTITTARITNCGQFLVSGHRNGSVIINKAYVDKIEAATALNYLKDTCTITCLALSGDSKTIAAASMYALFIASCKKLYDEASLIPTSQVASLLHVFKTTQPTIPQEVKAKFPDLRFAGKLKLLKEKGIDHEEFLCPICSEKTADILTSCGHEFCGDCLTSWQKEKEAQTCPICRAPLNTP